MRVAVIGSGAVGCYYGAMLERAGHEVRFLMRRDLDAVRLNGLTIHSSGGDFHIPAAAYGTSSEIGEVDLVLCALKTTAMDQAQSLIRPCVGPHTRIIALMNGLGVEEQFAGWFDPQRIFGGLAFVCINRGEPGVVHHMGYGRLVFGHLLNDFAAAEQIARIFADAGLDSQPTRSIRQGRWEKLMWNIPFSTLTITAGGVTTQEIMDDPGLRQLAEQLILETGRAGNADGCDIDVEAMFARMIADTEAMGPYRPSMLIDYLEKRPLEVESILGEPVRRAKRLNFPAPVMETQYHLTAFLDRWNRQQQ